MNLGRDKLSKSALDRSLERSERHRMRAAKRQKVVESAHDSVVETVSKGSSKLHIV